MSTRVERENLETEEIRTVKKAKVESDDGSIITSSETVEARGDISADDNNTNDGDQPQLTDVKKESQDTTREEELTPQENKPPVSSGFSGFSGFGGFASFQNSSTTFGGFAAKASGSSGFGTTASGSTGFGNTTGFGTGGFGVTASTGEDTAGDATEETDVPDSVPIVSLEEQEVANGEEGEDILSERRAKLFKLMEQDYVELGVGPFRVLKPKHIQLSDDKVKTTARMVMRRESYVRGPGTKLLLNARLNACISCIKKSEKALILIIAEATESSEEPKLTSATYLLRFGTSDDLDIIQQRIESLLPTV